MTIEKGPDQDASERSDTYQHDEKNHYTFFNFNDFFAWLRFHVLFRCSC